MAIKLQPACLEWARTRARLSAAELAKKMHVTEDKVLGWEQSGDITLAQVEKLSKATYVPVGYMFLPEPPVEHLPVTDFRTVGSAAQQAASPDLLDTLNVALRRQDWYRDYMVQSGEEPLSFVGSLSVNDDVLEAADKIRAAVEWNSELRAQARDWTEALANQTAAIENAGVLVMGSGVVGLNNNRRLDVNEFRGFALADTYAPLLFINHRDSKAARMFTLAHELVHIWLGESGVSNVDLSQANTNVTERFCNGVAAELLVPVAELARQWQLLNSRHDYTAELSKYFKVSELVIIRRLYDTSRISRAEFEASYLDRYDTRGTEQRDESTGGGHFHYTLRSRLGRRFSAALVASTLEGGTPYRVALSLMGVTSADVVKRFAQYALEAAA